MTKSTPFITYLWLSIASTGSLIFWFMCFGSLGWLLGFGNAPVFLERLWAVVFSAGFFLIAFLVGYSFIMNYKTKLLPTFLFVVIPPIFIALLLYISMSYSQNRVNQLMIKQYQEYQLQHQKEY